MGEEGDGNVKSGVSTKASQPKTKSTPHNGKQIAGGPSASCTHLIIEANGLDGYPGDWKVVNRNLRKRLDEEHYLIHASLVNRKKQTHQGVDICGQRLVEELRELISANPSLRYISMLGHSMGGILVRYAAGKLFDPSTGRIGGLEPAHFISLATPHLGSESAEGETQVPVVGWMARLLPSQAVRDNLTSKVRSLFGASGQQLFMNEHNAGRKDKPTDVSPRVPLLARLAFDVEGEGWFYSALRAFKSRTCYGNVDGDFLVGWANSTLRYADELPNLELQPGLAKGVVGDQGAACAFSDSLDQDTALPTLPARSPGDMRTPTSAADAATTRQSSVLRSALTMAQSGHAQPAASPVSTADFPPVALSDATTEQAELDVAVQVPSGTDEGVPRVAVDALPARHMELAAVADLPKAAMAALMLRRLQGMSWSRVDCAWRDARVTMFAHNYIQVTRSWLNWEGEVVCAHLAERIIDLEQYVKSLNEDYTVPIDGSQQAANGTHHAHG